MQAGLPDRARIVIIGGGVIGTSVAYHLALLGETDVLLLEQGQLSCGTTWHAAGLVGQLRASEAGTRLVQYSTRLYERLEAETGQATGFRRCGGLTVARTPDRLTALRRTAATALAYDIECELISPAEAAQRYPLLRAADLAGAIWLPGDGRADPVDLTAALARGARQRGVTDCRARPGDRGDQPRRAGQRCPHRHRRRRGRDRGQLRGPVGQAGRHAGRGHGAAALGRAFLRRDRPDRGRSPRPSGAAGPGRVDLLQGGDRRPGRRRFRARGQALGLARRAALPVRVPPARGGLGALRGADGQRGAPAPGAGRHRHPQVLQRAGELHPGQPVHPGGGAGAGRVLRGRRVQLGGHRLSRRGGPGARAVDHRRTARRGPDRGGHPPVRAVQRQLPLAARPGRRGARPALRDRLAEPRAGNGPAVPALAGLLAAAGGRGLLRLEDGLGTRQLLRPARLATR